MASMEETFRAAVQAGTLPGAVLLAKDVTGKKISPIYASAFGTRSLKDPSSNPPLELDTVMNIASATKLVTSVAAMQCVERGLIGLDDDVKPLVPEMEDGRRLLTHSSGYCYDSLSPLLMQWRKLNGQQAPVHEGDRLTDRYGQPLTFEPGTQWMYSPSIDWAGRVVECVYGDTPLETIMEQSIWQPLGIKDMTFYLQRRPDMLAKCGDMTKVDQSTGKLVHSEETFFEKDPEFAFGGGGLFTSPQEYMKILHSLLTNDGKLLRPESVDEFFRPQLEDKSRQSMAEVLSKPHNNVMNSLNPAGEKDWGLGGILLLEDGPDEYSRKAGTMSWSGGFHCFWFIDRKEGLCGFFASQIRHLTDPKLDGVKDLVHLFERTMYQRLRNKSSNAECDDNATGVQAVQ
ncbi:beta-lactamase [Gymnopus androsaceus JB14]|uniref:Beta-lactamase n=1 Tax=Gymnopus androsaceus JB14 TaxID=1447944 RepID=A0A6A4HCS6_9AGAR|nr:beta-lactamase [Gymnopus androsaceus JB14]